jgi:transcriptional regulator with XRE-family HTH domain
MAQRPDPQIALGEVICERREQLDMSQEEVALASGSSQGRISEIECGDNPSFGLSMRIATTPCVIPRGMLARGAASRG